MISVSGKSWDEIKFNQRIVDKIKLENNFNDLISRLIILNNFDQEEIYSINNDLDYSNPFKNNQDFSNAIKLLDQSIINNDKIAIIGDYDVDGCISTSLFVKLLKDLNIPHFYHIPNRYTEGYGANLKLIKKILNKKPKLIIMLDNGSNAHEAVNYLNKNKIKSIIIDHHEIYKPYPKADCIINPKKECDYNKYSYLCTAVLTFFLIEIYLKKKLFKINFSKNLYLVLMAIVSDVMPLRKINRYIAQKVLNNKKLYNEYLIKKIFEIKKIKKNVDIDDFAFLFGPIINSIGRIDDANIVIEMLSTNNISKKEKIIRNLILSNEKRKLLEADILNNNINTEEMIFKKDPIVFLYKFNFNEGIIGIIASRLKNYFNKPCVIITSSGNMYKGSCRSTSNFNIGYFIKQAIDLNIIENGGGHNLAAGFTIQKKNIHRLKKFLLLNYKKKNEIISNIYMNEISLSALNNNFTKNLYKLHPFGEGNNNPYFLITKIKILKPKTINNKYVTCYLKSKSNKIVQAISFSLLCSKITEHILYNKNEINLIVQINEKNWNNKRHQQIIIIDIISETNNA